MTIESKQLKVQGLKRCSCCKEIKPFSDFHKCSSRHDGLKEYCKTCKKAKEQSRWLKIRNNPEELKRRKINKKKWLAENKDYAREYHNNYCNQRRAEDIEFRILTNLRTRIVKVLNGNSKSKSTLKLVGCSLQVLRQHLEAQFLPDMSWDNYGEWHIDHIIPCDSFDLTKKSAQYQCFHYTNLQPLWEEDNLKKSNKLIYDSAN